MSGANISRSDVETKSQITSVEKDGFWLLTDEGEFFVTLEQYPAFQKATIEQIFNFREHFEDFYWEELDIDIELDALKNPGKYPLKFE